MSEINYQFSRHNAKNAQHLQFSKNELIAIPQAMATKYGFINPWNAYNQAVQNQSNCYKPEQSYLDTPEVETTDRARDEVFLFYSRVIQDYADYGLEDILMERARELCFERWRWYDLARTGMFEQFLEDRNEYATTKTSFDGKKHYVFPIPLSEIQISENKEGMYQNPYYE